jgi:predicted nucleotidyltransferase
VKTGATSTLPALSQALAARGTDVDCIIDALQLTDGEAAYVAGSLVDGLGGPDADLDIFVVTDRARFQARTGGFASERRVQQRQLDFGIVYLHAGELELDVELHPVEKFDALFAALDLLRPVTRAKLWESFRWLGPVERSHALELLHRLRCSWPLGDIPAYASLRARFDEQTFLDWNTLFCLMECEDYAKGVLKLRRYYDSLADAALFARGQSLDRWKWRLPKLRCLGDEELLAQYLDVQLSPAPHDTGALAEFVASALQRGRARHAVLVGRFE